MLDLKTAKIVVLWQDSFPPKSLTTKEILLYICRLNRLHANRYEGT